MLLIGLVSIGATSLHTKANENRLDLSDFFLSQEPDSATQVKDVDDGTLKYPIKEKGNNPNLDKFEQSDLDLEDPDNASYRSEYDPKTNQVTIYRKVGGMDVRLPYTMSLQDYMNNDMRKSMGKYYRDKIQSDAGNGTPSSGKNWLGTAWKIGGEGFESVFGSNSVSIKSQGTAEITMGVKNTKIDNPTLQEALRSTTTFDFNQKIQVNVQAAIGDKLKMGLNYNTEASFEFENQTKIEYSGKEDDIIKKIEFGNVTMPLPGTLITGSQSLFGVKTELQFGKLNVVALFSQQKGQTQVLNVQGGAQQQEFEISASEYDKNRHFFLSLAFRDSFEANMKNLPIISSPFVIQKVEVWVTNKSGNHDAARNIVAFKDLGETQFLSTIWSAKKPEPSNNTNDLYEQMSSTHKEARDINKVSKVFSGSFFTPGDFRQTKDYEKIESARKLAPTEFTFNPTLGFISLNSALNNDEVLAVAYVYTMGGSTYTVGDLSNSGIEAPNALYLKLLKGTNLSPEYKTTWNLMMKNIYSLGAFQVNKDDFKFDVALLSDSTGGNINYFPEGNADVKRKRLLKLMGLDNLNQQNEPDEQGDGVFDFIEGFTIYPSNGRVIFPSLEPFGSNLAKQINDPAIAKKFVYQELYDSTITNAGQNASKNKFRLKGKYKSTQGSDISLNAMDIPQGGVTVSAGGIRLVENVDYTVDYTLGRVKIINKGLLESGTPIQVSLESRALFNMQTKTMMGVHLDYKFNPKLNIGATVMHLNEKPMTTKVSIGDEPISNTIWGLNGSYISESPALTNFLNKAPWWNLKEVSSISIDGEIAQLIPGHNSAVGKTGQSYIDDFEGTATSIDLRSWTSWSLASTPQGQSTLFPEGNLIDDLNYGKNRARLSWYVIDPLFYTSLRPGNISSDDISDDRVRQVQISEIFPERQTAYGQPNNIAVLNLAYYPKERGQYNYDDTNIDATGELSNPETRWGGIVRPIETNDFEAANIEYIDFWMMDPRFNKAPSKGGKLYINLGSISEDVLRDGRKSFEQGLPVPGVIPNVDTTVWGVVSNTQSVVNAFTQSSGARAQQDVGLDGLSSTNENVNFSKFLSNLPAAVKAKMEVDPSSDDFHYFKGSDYDQQKKSITDRYKFYNNQEGNSKESTNATESSTGFPDQEDINKDNTLSETESYFQYAISLDDADFVVGKNNIVNSINNNNIKQPNGKMSTATWYHFRIPVNSANRESINNMKDLRSVRFMRMFLKGCTDTTILRFASLDLVRSDWRRYTDDLMRLNAPSSTTTAFDISAVNIEADNDRTPINYVLPPGVTRVQDPSNPQNRQLNEQSLVMRVKDLGAGDARGAYKTLNMDIRQYKYLKMFVHAEALEQATLKDEELMAFIRIGSDFTNNYYEYEVPLKVTQWGQNGADQVWPASNEMNIKLENLEKIKLSRNNYNSANNSDNKLYSQPDPDFPQNNIIIVGSPNISNVRSIMIGVRTRKNTDNLVSPRSAEIWMNELRLSDYDEQGGWASNARVNIKLSDFGSVTLAGATSSIGFGSIEKSVSERSQQDFYQYDVASNLELGKFLGPNSRMSIPFYGSNSQAVATPKYYPLDPDITMSTALSSVNTNAERDSIKGISQDVTTRKSINFTNVKLQPKSDKVKVYDISNVSATYSYNETSKHNFTTTSSIDKNYRGVLGYNYTTRPKAYEPFSSVASLNNPAFRLIKDFNIYPYPNQISYSHEVTRNYREEQLRNLGDPDQRIDPTYKKDFYWNKFFDLKYAITKNLKFDFRSISNARIDEPTGRVNSNDSTYGDWGAEVGRNFRKGGRTTSYQHNFNFNYTLPINKLPYLDWTSASLRYGGMYNWMLAPISRDTTIKMGNTIRNSNTIQGTGQLTFSSLYNKSNYLKGIWKKYDFDPAPKAPDQQTGSVRFTDNGLTFVKSKPVVINHKLKTVEVSVKAFDKSGRPINGTTTVVSPTKVEFTPDADADGARVLVTGTVKESDTPLTVLGDVSALLLTSIKNVSVSYSESNGTILPGFTNGSGVFGMSGNSPGLPFLMGAQNTDFAQHSIDKGWMTQYNKFNSPYKMVNTRDISIKGNFEPFRGFKIELIADQRTTYNMSEYYSPNKDFAQYKTPHNTTESGSYSMSFIAISTFKKLDTSGDMHSDAYDTFLSNRKAISARLGAQNSKSIGTDSAGYASGYGALSQDVLIPAFLSAYSGTSTGNIFLDAMPALSKIMPNWRISYDGIGRIKWVSQFAKNVDISHAYRCTYSVGAYSTNLLVDSVPKDNAGNFIAQNQIGTVLINEQFSPLILVNITWVNNLTTRAEFKKGRMLNLSMSNNQLIENYNEEMIFGLGYRFDKLGLILNNAKTTNDINLRADFSIRDNISVIRKIEEQVNQLTSGTRITALTITADYALNSRYNLQLYYKRNMNTPYISLSYPTVDYNFGLSFRMSLAQ